MWLFHWRLTDASETEEEEEEDVDDGGGGNNDDDDDYIDRFNAIQYAMRRLVITFILLEHFVFVS
jgi:hypothetical protein